MMNNESPHYLICISPKRADVECEIINNNSGDRFIRIDLLFSEKLEIKGHSIGTFNIMPVIFEALQDYIQRIDENWKIVYNEHPLLKKYFSLQDTGCALPKEVEKQYMNLGFHHAPMEEVKKLLESHGIPWLEDEIKELAKKEE